MKSNRDKLKDLNLNLKSASRGYTREDREAKQQRLVLIMITY